MTLLLDQFRSCATNQLPSYAENALNAIPAKSKGDFVKVLIARLGDVEKESKRKRIERVTKKLTK
jgi:hypothetical protein